MEHVAARYGRTAVEHAVKVMLPTSNKLAQNDPHVVPQVTQRARDCVNQSLQGVPKLTLSWLLCICDVCDLD